LRISLAVTRASTGLIRDDAGRSDFACKLFLGRFISLSLNIFWMLHLKRLLSHSLMAG
jgi:hypothetical protein